MELARSIKQKRTEKSLSQEELADKVYVSRQTISNWENERSYPDINSLILLSEVFETTIDNLIKGDVKAMKEINTKEVKDLNFYSAMMLVFIIPAIITVIPLAYYIELYAFIPFFVLCGISMFFALKVEKIKKSNNIQTYKEILAFIEGEKLDEVKQIEENAKRPYQKIMMCIVGAIVALAICGVMAFIFH